VLRPYRDLFARPGALAFSAAGVIARVPMSMVGIAVVLVVSTRYGSYGLAGRVSAVVVVTAAVTGPWIARMVDRHGQGRVLRPALATSCAGLVVLAVGPAAGVHPAWLYAGAVLAGCGGNVGALVRARWSHVLADEPRLVHTAYSLESALDELVFVVGPVAATALATSRAPQLGLLVPCAAVLAGGAWFVAQRGTEPPVASRQRGHRGGSVLRLPGVACLLLAFVGTGVIFGATDVSTVAFATEQGHKGAAGAVLAVFAAGSMTAGLLYGARHWRGAQVRRFATAIVLLALGACLFLVVRSLGALAATMFVVGLAISPSIIAGNGLMQELVPPGRLTEGLTWVGTAINIGASVGASVGGSRIDAAGSHGGYLFIVAVAAAVVAVVALGYRGMRRAARRHATADLVEPVSSGATGS
jgi:MFS family permease